MTAAGIWDPVTLQSRRRDRRPATPAGAAALFGQDDLIAELQVAADDFGKAIVVEPERDSNPSGLAPGQHPDLSRPTRSLPRRRCRRNRRRWPGGRSGRLVAKRLIGHTNDIV